MSHKYFKLNMYQIWLSASKIHSFSYGYVSVNKSTDHPVIQRPQNNNSLIENQGHYLHYFIWILIYICEFLLSQIYIWILRLSKIKKFASQLENRVARIWISLSDP